VIESEAKGFGSRVKEHFRRSKLSQGLAKPGSWIKNIYLNSYNENMHRNINHACSLGGRHDEREKDFHLPLLALAWAHRLA
jgi:hypothetical protein